MIDYHGEFVNQKGDTVSVRIMVSSDAERDIEIGGEDSGVSFDEDPVEVRSEMNDTFDHLLRHSATIRLLARDFQSALFVTDCRKAVVRISRGGNCVFAGFLAPRTYQQPFNEVEDSLELNCIDTLAALQYARYGDVGKAGVSYAALKASVDQVTMASLVTGILQGIMSGVVAAGETVNYWYDGSKAIDSQNAHSHSILNDILVNELLFLGDSEDDTWQQDQVLEEVLRYLNLHIVQEGLTYYIFSWETVKDNQNISWRDLVSGATATTSRKTVDISLDIAEDTNTTISMGDVYNHLELTCDVKSVTEVVESPLDDGAVLPCYTSKQKYMTEYSSDGEGERAYNAFRAMVMGERTTYANSRITDWYVQVMKNIRWTFPMGGNGSDLVDLYCQDNQHEEQLPNWLSEHAGAALLSIGSIEMKANEDDDSPTSKVTMENQLVISVNGNDDDSESGHYPQGSDILSNMPYAEYKGQVSGGTFSPVDEETTNYIVISGRIVLNPLMKMTHDYPTLRSWSEQVWAQEVFHHTVPSRDNEDGRYYTRQYWQAETPRNQVTWDATRKTGFVPYTGKGPEQYEFKYSDTGDNTDRLSKVSVLACMLVIGDQCVVETGTQGQPGDFHWQKYKERSECQSDDEYYQQCFYIGFNPKIGDKLVGTEFDIQNTIDYTMGVDAEGIAIPIRKSDGVSGRVTFKILGPVANVQFNEITRRHPSFWRHTKWSENEVLLLSHVSSIVIKRFEMNVYSDNGLTNSDGESDIVYVSDTDESFVNKKDDLEFKITSALTAAECHDLGVATGVALSSPLKVSNRLGVETIYDRVQGVEAKAEQFYVDSYYREWHEPRVEMEQTLTDGEETGLFLHYRHPALSDKEFFVEGITRNLMEGCAYMKLKEIEK